MQTSRFVARGVGCVVGVEMMHELQLCPLKVLNSEGNVEKTQLCSS